MDKLIHQAIEFLKQESAKTGSVLASPEEMEYFSPKRKAAAVIKEKKSASSEIDPEMRQMVAKILPDIALTFSIPDDAIAQKMAHLYKEQHLSAKVVVLSFGETGSTLQFLQNVTKAINTLIAPARLLEMRKVERDNGWELTLSSPTLQLVLAPPFNAWKTISLARFYRENPATKTHLLRETPVLFMQSIGAYLKNPDLKRELWKNLSTLLSSST